MRTIFIIGLLGVVFVGGYIALRGVTEGDTSVLQRTETPTDIQEYFTQKLREGVIKNLGQPIEGFVPSMFTQVFTGLVPQDFEGVDALLGTYQFIEQELVFTANEGGVLHSAARAISDAGMEALFLNIVNRVGATGDGDASFTTTDEIDQLLVLLGDTPLADVFTCTSEQRAAEACIEIYQPVCASVRVECVTTPCDPVQETISNACKACQNDRVLSYTEGACQEQGI